MTLPDDVYNFVRLTPEEERELFVRFRTHGDLKARDRIINCHIRYGMKLARRVLGAEPSDHELLSIVGTALVRAVSDGKYDPNLSRFGTWAAIHIRRDCIDAHEYRLPVRMSSRAFTRFSKAGRAPVRISLNSSGSIAGSDSFTGGQKDPGHRLADTITELQEATTIEYNPDLDREKIEQAVRDALLTLTDRERQTVLGRYWNDEVFDDAGRQMGCSREWARRIHDSAMTKIKRHLNRVLDLGLK